MEKEQLIEKIKKLKQEKNALIVAHYYVDDDIQDLADYIGDSYYLSKVCMTRPEKLIIFCGVRFMGESAKILNPEKTVIMAEELADCPMAHMVEVERIKEIRNQYEDVAVVCYINSTTEIKAESDVVVTSANAYTIVSKLPQKNIFFVPDEHLGRYISKKLPDKNFIFNDGFCHVHTSITQEAVLEAKSVRPEAEILVHPECKTEVVEMADYVGSTSGILKYATDSDKKEFIICTEMGILHQLRKANPDKKFYSVGHRQFCPNMKRISVKDVYEALETERNPIQLEGNLIERAKSALENMHALAN